jgi:hypothetical protein
LPFTASLLPDTPQFALQRDRLLVTTFHSPLTVPSLESSVPGSSLLACYFTHSPAVSAARSVFPLRNPCTGLRRFGLLHRFRPVAASTACSFRRSLAFTPSLGFLRPSRSTRLQVPLRSGPPSKIARFPLTPRRHFVRVGCGSSLLVRYFPAFATPGL